MPTVVVVHGEPTYHPSMAWGAHEAHFLDGSKMSALVPRGAKRVLLKSKIPSKTSYAYLAGSILELHRRLRVISA